MKKNAGLLLWHPHHPEYIEELGESVLVQLVGLQAGPGRIAEVAIHHGPLEGVIYFASYGELMPMEGMEL